MNKIKPILLLIKKNKNKTTSWEDVNKSVAPQNNAARLKEWPSHPTDFATQFMAVAQFELRSVN